MTISIRMLIALGLVLGGGGHAWGETRQDPTRPPPAWLLAQPGARAASLVEPDTASGLRVLVVGKSRKFAVVDGQVVKPGDTYDGSKILAIKADGVIMEGGEGGEGARSLKVAPGIEKTVLMPRVLKPALKKSNAVAVGESK